MSYFRKFIHSRPENLVLQGLRIIRGRFSISLQETLGFSPRSFIIKTLSTFFYIGYLPFAPGTFASIAAAFLFYLFKKCVFGYVALTLCLLLLGFLVSGSAERMFGRKDARYIVIDEIAGMLLSFFSLVSIPWDIRLIALAFILFRILDILKPYPINKLHQLHGSIGIMSDDIAGGLYTNIILQAFFRLVSFKIS